MNRARVLLALFASLLAAGSAAAQNYPDRPVRIVVGFTAGSATDITARLFAQKFSDAWGVAVTVENVPGAGGSTGVERVAKSPPDGYTLMWGANGALRINPSLQPKLGYDPTRDLAPVSLVLAMPSILAINNDVPAKTFQGVRGTRQGAARQAVLRHARVGTPQHIAGELLKMQAGIDVVHIPYRGAVFTDVIGGRVTMAFQSAGAALPIVRQGQRFRGDLLVRPARPGRNARVDRRQAAPGNPQSAVTTGHAGEVRAARPRSSRQLAGRAWRHPRGRRRQVGEGDQGSRDQGAGIATAVG